MSGKGPTAGVCEHVVCVQCVGEADVSTVMSNYFFCVCNAREGFFNVSTTAI